MTEAAHRQRLAELRSFRGPPLTGTNRLRNKTHPVNKKAIARRQRERSHNKESAAATREPVTGDFRE